ncbi:hypothetical protein [Aquabacterium sp. A08]|uniref:hypothetical protein n=1 Tax=Aquabacterium sp. A08 TaxID=2718532 RepID=UPI001422776B|nr:hypothetical protein [Aquabacterium sp. A08]NIC43739.1 hypothetical protein [Aquabacterium sp. A08]
MTDAAIDGSLPRIFVFEENYPQRAAQEQAEKKKLSAFGMMAKFNPLNRPREDTVQLVQHELRWEPFWHIVARRELDYTCQLTYTVPVNNPWAQSLQIDNRIYEVQRLKDKARIEFVGLEHCQRTIAYDRWVDAMQRDLKAADLEALVRRYQHTEHQAFTPAAGQLVAPRVSLVAAQQMARSALSAEAVNALEIHQDQVVFESCHLYVRPVFAFEFKWTTADKLGVIEVDGLNGEVVENGHWFRDKVQQVVTRDMLLDLGADVANSLVPGGGFAVKTLAKLASPTPPRH